MKTKNWLTSVLLGMGLSSPVIAQTPQITAAPLGIQDAVSAALSTSTRVKIAEHDLQGQLERRRGAWADVGPRIKVDYNQVYFEDKQTAMLGPQEITLRDDVAKTGSVTIGQPIMGAFALAAKAKMEGSLLDIKEDGLAFARADAGYQAAEIYLRARQAGRLFDILESSLAAAEGQRKDGAALERAGRLNRGDVLKLELAVSEAKARLAQARAGREIAFAGLREAMGLPANAPLNLTQSTPDVQLGPVTDAETVYAAALERRLEIRQGRSGVDVAGFAKKLAYSNFSPGVNVFVKWDKNFGEPAGLGATDAVQRTYGIQASWDLWNNGSHVFAVREAAENVAKAEEGNRGLEQQIRLELTQTIANLQASKESLAVAQTAVAQAEEAYRIEMVRFKSGSRSATDLIFAEASQANAQGRLIAAQTDLVSWQLKLQRALGDTEPKFR